MSLDTSKSKRQGGEAACAPAAAAPERAATPAEPEAQPERRLVPLDVAPELVPVKLPEIMPSLRIRQLTPFGNMHVKVSVDPISSREREVFAQLGKGGDLANSDLEAICRILSLWLRSNGSLHVALSQLQGIGSSLSVPTKDGRIMSLADGLAKALQRYLEAKETYGLEALLLGRVAPEALSAPTAPTAREASASNGITNYKLKCPQCEQANLSFEEGCVKCYGCGYSQC